MHPQTYKYYRIRSKTGISLEIIFLMSLNLLHYHLFYWNSYFGNSAIFIFIFNWYPLQVCYGAGCVRPTPAPSGRSGTLLFLREQMYTFSSTFSKKFKLLSTIIVLCQGYDWIWKNTNEEFNCVMILRIRPKIKHFAIPFFLGFS